MNFFCGALFMGFSLKSIGYVTIVYGMNIA